MNASPMSTPAASIADQTVGVMVPATASRMATIREFPSVVVPYIRYGALRIGKTGVAGVLLCLISFVMFVSGNLPARQQVAEQTAMLEAARIQSVEKPTDVLNKPNAGVVRFVQQLPSINDVPGVLGSIVSVAATTGIELESGTYEYVMADGETIARYQMTLPVTGTYPEVKQFIEDVLASVPAVALEGMRIERGKVSDQIVSADLRFTLLLGPAS